MPKYRVQLSDGRIVTVEAAQPPTEEQILAQLGPKEEKALVDINTGDLSSLKDRVASSLPTVGGLVGSFVGRKKGGPVGQVLGAGAGGALGKGAELLVDDADQTLGEGLKAMGQEALIQGGADLAGTGTGKLLKAGASRLYQSAMKPSAAVRREFPTVVQDAIQEGVAVGKSGVEKAQRLLTNAGQQARGAVQAAEAAGAKPVNMRPVVSHLQRTTAKVEKQPLREIDLQTVRGVRDQVLKENPKPIALTAAHDMKQAAQRKASEGYRKIDRGADINSVPLDAQMDIASGLRAAIERRVPEVAGLNQRTQKLIGVARAAEDAEGRIGNNAPIGLGMSAGIAGLLGMGTGMASGDAGAGTGTGLAVLALTNPALASRLAIGANRMAPVASHVPNAARAAILAELLGSSGQ